MVKVLFTETRVVQDGTGTTFEAGKVYDLPVASADRWKRRGVAVDAPPEPVKEPQPVKEPEPEVVTEVAAVDPEADFVFQPPRRGRPPKSDK